MNPQTIQDFTSSIYARFLVSVSQLGQEKQVATHFHTERTAVEDM